MRRVSWLFPFSDLSAFLIAILFAYWVRFSGYFISLLEHQPISLYLRSALLLIPLYLFLLYGMGNYQNRHGRLSQYEVQNLIRSLFFFYLLCIACTFLIHSLDYSRTTIGLCFFFNVFLILLLRRLVVALQRRLWIRGLGTENLLIIGSDEELGDQIKNNIEKDPRSGFRIANYMPLQHPICIENPVDRVLLVGDVSYSDIADVVLATPEGVRVDFVPTYYMFLRSLPFKEEIGSFPVIPLNQRLLSDWNSFAKRVTDITISAIALLLLWPLMALIALIIQFTYGKPILYTQERVGQNGQLFILRKFRTMKMQAEQETIAAVTSQKQTIFKWKNDPRVVNSFARFLRRTGLDELPQLWNVLSGEMSLVGPRPATLELIRNYSAEHKLRLAMPPGITGLQQISCRGTDSMEEILKYDLCYISEQNFWLDLYIMMKTLQSVLSGKGVT